MAIKMAAAAATLAMCSACTTTGHYDPKYFAPSPIASDKVLVGRARVQMTAEDEGFVFSGRPTTLCGSAGTLVLPLGEITREAALSVFGALFKGGAEAASAVPPARGGHAVIVSPRVERFSYAYGFGEFRPALVISVAVLDAEGRTLLDRRTYETVGSAAVSRDQPVESISRTTQLVVQSLDASRRRRRAGEAGRGTRGEMRAPRGNGRRPFSEAIPSERNTRELPPRIGSVCVRPRETPASQRTPSDPRSP